MFISLSNSDVSILTLGILSSRLYLLVKYLSMSLFPKPRNGLGIRGGKVTGGNVIGGGVTGGRVGIAGTCTPHEVRS